MDQFCFGHYDMTTSQKIKIIGYFFIVWPMDNCIKFSGQKSKKSALGFKGLIEWFYSLTKKGYILSAMLVINYV